MFASVKARWAGIVELLKMKKTRAEFQTILGADGRPAFVVLPYDDWIQVIANRMDAGAVVAMDQVRRYSRPGRLSAASADAVTAMTAGALSALPALSDVPPLPQIEDLLPGLEEIQIEGAEVLPEIEQTLSQVDISLASVQGVSASVMPAPHGVADIKTAMDSINLPPGYSY